MKRRRFLQLASAAGLYNSVRGFAQGISPTLEPWQPGMLDIHHLAYGRGNSTFILGPDGTTFLIDAGVTKDSTKVSCAQKPDTHVRPGEWIASYALRQMKPAGRKELDYALITHIHPDHLGDPTGEVVPSTKGNYQLTGITDVDAKVPIQKLIDRAFPDYSYPTPWQAPFAQNYMDYVHSRQRLGEPTERITVGSSTQIHLVQHPDRYKNFTVRNLAANGEVWTGIGEQTHKTFPDLKELAKQDYPNENMCSIALRLSYGKFDYFTGGDLTSGTEEESTEPWRDIETAAAKAAGPVEVAIADHHAFFDAVGPNFVRELRPEAFIIPAWYVSHPSTLPLRRMFSSKLYPGDRDVFATCTMEENKVFNNQFNSKMKSLDGHVVVRVAPGGETFQIVVTDNSDDSDRVKLVSGPYRCS
ncbi:MBL fold metallo-hydrolase [Granulicella sp. WH15]|uniref:ComEC/Rec2 family competence protein n=1 Tax=Granulicella sp. WH15 TaxID=2602070 RepID=UPI001366805B|nr:MBL fold metallo-hydrolase [Granulicella sp. WH15]QHN03163.1 MBL fold metallo-hydrolase [Granulicella sp. WH15]